MNSRSRRDLAMAVVADVIATFVVMQVASVVGAIPFNLIFVPALAVILTVTVCILVVRQSRRAVSVRFEELRNDVRPFADLGIKGIWRDEVAFREARGISYGEYCAEFVRNTKSGDTVRMIGYDWQELLPTTAPLQADILEGEHSRLQFQIILGDPKSPAMLEKRTWEMVWKDSNGDTIYPEGFDEGSVGLLQKKIENCVAVAELFVRRRPDYVQTKLTPTLLSLSILMNSERAVGVFYSYPFKGKDSPIFEVIRGGEQRSESKVKGMYGSDFYGFLRGYFDSVWQDPSWKAIDVRRHSST